MIAEENTIHINGENFADKISSSDKLVSIFFYSPNCPHCKEVLPIYEKLADTMDDVVFGKINVLNQREITLKNGIDSVPTIIFYCESKRLGKMRGEINETLLKNTIKDYQKYRKSCSKTTSIYQLDGYA